MTEVEPLWDDRVPEGTRLGRWVIGPRLGDGSTAVVYKAVHADTGQPAAVKVLNNRQAASPEARGRFLQEGRVAARMIHANVVRVYDVGVEQHRFYLAMELLEGDTLAAEIKRCPRGLPIGIAVRLVIDLCHALSAVHALEVLHRDIKPGNITLVPDGHGGWTPCLLDFGFSKTDDSHRGDLLNTGPGLIGTPAYMSPEAALGNRTLDGRSDLFSLGVVLYECLTGHGPFMRDTLQGTLQALVKCSLAPVRALRPEVPEGLDATVRRVLSFEPEARHPDAATLAAALEEYASAPPVT